MGLDWFTLGKTLHWCQFSKLHKMKWAWTDLRLLRIRPLSHLLQSWKRFVSCWHRSFNHICHMVFAREITLSEPIKCCGGNARSQRKMKNIIAEELFAFYQWNHPVSNSLTEALVKNSITICSVHIYRGEQKYGGLQFSNTTKKKCNWSCWTLHRCWSAHKRSGSFYCWILYVQVTQTIWVVPLGFNTEHEIIPKS